MASQYMCIALILLPLVSPFGIGKRDGLYGPEDVGIVNLEAGNFSKIVLGSKTAFIVEFYSSYCGHCINFAPTFKEFARQVADWKSVIQVGAIDCAQDVNMPTCREYEIMGYPSLKFFPVNADKNDLGELRKSFNKEIGAIVSDMLDYVEKIEMNKSLAGAIKHWPKLSPITALDDIWENDVSFAVVVVESSDSLLGRQLVLDVWPKIRDLGVPIVVRRVVADTEIGRTFVHQVGLAGNRKVPIVVTVDRKNKSQGNVLWDNGSNPRAEMAKAVNDFIWAQTKSLTGVGDRAISKNKKKDKLATIKSEEESGPVLNESEIKRRRYTAFMSDLENSILYSLSHEVSQRAVITDKLLTSLQNYLDVLVKYFPGRRRTMNFLEQLSTFVRSHEDVLRGEDLQDQLTELRVSTKAFSDLGKDWIGCKGSKPIYGGYPCSAWTLWHTLTIAQRKSGQADPREVLRAMVSYIDNYFGCRECARHFLLVAEDGKAVEREVTTHDMAVLWLWKAHNKANKRLSGDLTDDKSFPKEIFPNRQHCSQCYDDMALGSDLWSEFRRDKVLDFLKNLYDSDNVNMQGLELDLVRDGPVGGKNFETHDLMIAEEHESANKKYSERENKNWGLSFSSIDVSLCFGIYVLSAAILVLVYLKFVAKKRLSHLLSAVGGKRRSSNYSSSNV